MIPRRIRAAALAVTATLGLGACTTYDGYAGGSYFRGGYALSDGGPYYGWYDNAYYPGNGHYLYDRSGNRRAMNRAERQHWLSRSRSAEDRQQIRQNYTQFRADRQGDRAQLRTERQVNRAAYRSGQIGREQFRTEQQGDRRAFRQERRSDQRSLRQDNRRALRD